MKECKKCGVDLEKDRRYFNSILIAEATEWLTDAKAHLENIRDRDGKTLPEVSDSVKKCIELLKILDSVKEDLSR